MLVESASNPQFISNTYLLADGVGGPAFFIDAGGPVQPLIATAERIGLTPTHILLTHHHYDHVCDVGTLLERWPELEVLISARERELIESAAAGDGEGGGAGSGPAAGWGAIEAGQSLSFGKLDVRALHTPGHTAGMLSFLVAERSGEDAPAPRAGGGRSARRGGGGGAVFTGDTLFKDSVGGGDFDGIRDAVMRLYMAMPHTWTLLPGHTDASTIGREWEQNPFIAVWRDVQPEGSERVSVHGTEATLIVWSPDYDGNGKAWVRYDDGSDAIVGGSAIERQRRAHGGNAA